MLQVLNDKLPVIRLTPVLISILSKYKNSSKYLHIFVTIFSLFYPFCQHIFHKKYTIAIRIYCFQYIKISVTNSH